ncbi:MULTISPECIES: NHL repeat-containing protein [Variovorax]|uniref:NHL repeat-containing protein n=1 Tax=Variovorax TaxID=34072 RepID=UPI00177B25FB|nr:MULTISPECIES: NHL repeat-containing protein [Variovorax]MBD9664882.1 NHL repeat-containing protein [Variovorax sp. VRV01]MDR6451629.1 DNA-binding beta-propeller fold protein YncE [Variovorax paradoxus]
MKHRSFRIRLPLLGLALLATATHATTSALTPAPPAWTLEKRPAHDELSSPVGMAYDAAGHLYVANWSAGTVLRFAPDGARSVFASGLSGPSGLAISPSGDIFVASYSQDLVWRFTPGGRQSVFVSGLATPAGLSFDRKGRLLIANRRTNEILAAHPDGRIEVAAQGLQSPVGAVELPGGELMVSNIAGGISLVGPDGRARSIHDGLRSPGPGIVADPEGTAAYVVDYGGTTVSRIDREGGRVVLADGLSSPVGLARTPDGNLLVATWGANAAFRLARPR